jgi:hypothetical protein
VIVGGTTGQAVVFRGLGPSLTSFSIATPIPNPTLTIMDAFGTTVATNDDWQSDPSASIIATLGLGPTNTLEAATLVTLPPGGFTALLSDLNGNTGIGLIEIYNVTSDLTQ